MRRTITTTPVAELRAVVHEVLKEINHCHRDDLLNFHPDKPLTSRWPLVYEKLRDAQATGNVPALTEALQEALGDIAFHYAGPRPPLPLDERAARRWSYLYERGRAGVAVLTRTGKSPGTRHMIELTKSRGLRIFILKSTGETQ